jgi:uncharacterized MnhB-related membrane protein
MDQLLGIVVILLFLISLTRIIIVELIREIIATVYQSIRMVILKILDGEYYFNAVK